MSNTLQSCQRSLSYSVKALALTTIAVVSGVATAGSQGVGTTTRGIEGGSAVPPSQIARTGAVHLFTPLPDGTAANCSGMLVTPWWVLTAAHCNLTANTVIRLGNINASGVKTARVAKSFPHPEHTSGAAFDASLLKLATPLDPVRDDGRAWTWYRRDLVRLDVIEPGGMVDIYGYGLTGRSTPAGNDEIGVLQFGRFQIENVKEHIVHYDGDVVTQGGDSGAAVLVSSAPGPDSPGRAWEHYRIFAVHAGWHWRPVDVFARGARAASLRPWFDSIVGRPPLSPASTLAAIGGL